jgi:hypothetical protein
MIKPQDPRDTVRTCHTTIIQSMSTTSTQMVVDHQETGRRILGHPRKKGSGEHPIIEETITTKEGAHQARAKVTVEAHSSLHTVCTLEMTQPSHKRLSNLLRIQKKNGARPQPASATILIQESQPHNVVATTPSVPFAFSSTNSPKQ